MEPIDLTGLTIKQKNLLVRYGVTLELLQILSLRDLKKIPRLGKNGRHQIVIGLSVETFRLRRQNEAIKSRVQAIFSSPHEIPASNLIFRGIIDSTQWFRHFQVKLRGSRYATYGDIVLLSCEDACGMFGKKTCRAIKRELGKYDLRLAE